MKAFVIKNKKGRYYATVNPVSGFIFTEFIEYAMQFDEEQDAKDDIWYRKMKNCTIIPITISEGDLEEENRVLKKALELACEELVSRDGCSIIPEDESLESYVEEYIQQAKESEKDERNWV